jgi:hypothetical protein
MLNDIKRRINIYLPLWKDIVEQCTKLDSTQREYLLSILEYLSNISSLYIVTTNKQSHSRTRRLANIYAYSGLLDVPLIDKTLSVYTGSLEVTVLEVTVGGSFDYNFDLYIIKPRIKSRYNKLREKYA